VIKYLSRVLLRSGRDPAAVAALLEDLADRTLSSEFELSYAGRHPRW
jgi:hypothetical protein